MHQWIAGSTETGNRNRLLTCVKLPPFGYRQIRISQGETNSIKDPVVVKEKSLENEFLRITFSYSGTISIFDKISDREVITEKDAGYRALIINDPSDTWSHNIRTYGDLTGAFGNAAFKILEQGPLRGAIRTITTYGNSSLTTDWLLTSGSPVIETRITLNWNERLKILKFSFPVNVESPAATYETAYGNIERAVNGDEDPGQRWIDLSGHSKGNDYGLTIINDAKYGYSVHGNDLRISVVRSAVYGHHDPKKLDMNAEHIWMDQGIQTFRMLLIPHKGRWKNNNIVRNAEEFIAPSIAIYQGIHKGSQPKSRSFISLDAPNIILAAAKLAENNNDLILRCIETEGQDCMTNLDLRFSGTRYQCKFRPYEIKTLRMNRKTGQIREVNLLEE